MARAERRRERQELNATLQYRMPAVLEASRRLQTVTSIPEANDALCENQDSGTLDEVASPQRRSAFTDVPLPSPDVLVYILTAV